MPPVRPAVSAAVLGLSGLVVAGERYRLAVAEHFGLGVAETYAISFLDTYGPMSQGRLAVLMGVTSGGATGVVDRLERAGTARRAPDPADRRRNRIELTERATTILATSREGLARAFDEIDDATLDVLVSALPQVAAGVDRETAALTP